MTQHLMLVPSLDCPAACRYCFGPHEGSQRMTNEIVQAAIEWQKRVSPSQALEVTFHGGEPLMAGSEFYRGALPALRSGLSSRQVSFAIQSNLWLLTDELCDLFREYSVSIGTSLDGPEAINDAQRGKGYFRRTMAGIERLREHGVEAGCICTFTRASLPYAQEIFDFFLKEGLNFSIHAAVPSLQYPKSNEWSLSSTEHGTLMVEMLERYLLNVKKVRISTLDQLCRSVTAGHGGICTFGDCLGSYLAVGPDGTIYPCQRFAGLDGYALGNVLDCPAQEALEQSPTWQMLAEREQRIAEECGECSSFNLCRGGCPYNALAAGGGKFNGKLKDPHCEGYQRIFTYISKKALEEVFSEENLTEVVEKPDPQKGLLRKGRLLSLMRAGTHPTESARHARRILAAAALAVCSTPEEAADKLQRAGVLANPGRSLPALRTLDRRLNAPIRGLNNLYLHITFDCNLRCAHCYASAGERNGGFTSADNLRRACREAASLGFRHAVITGGEPLIHPLRDDVLATLAELRQEIKPLLTVLRTNLAVPMNDDLLRQVALATDQVVVSVDGDRKTHDERRGAGSYARTLANLRLLAAQCMELSEAFTDLSLATVLPLEQVNSEPGESVRALAKELGIRRTRFRPLLPLGRAAESEMDIVPETLWGHLGADELVAYGFTPTASCGMGQNLYVEPDGEAFPCYAWHSEAWSLGNIFSEEGLSGLMNSERFRDLGEHTVNTNQRCKQCTLRYLCGGACRAWSRLPGERQADLDAPPLDCAHLFERASAMLKGALGYLEIPIQDWASAGLPLEQFPPKEITLEKIGG